MKPFKKVSQCYAALSGGVDSVAVTHYYHSKGKLKAALWYDHDNEISRQEKVFVTSFCEEHSIDLIIGNFDVLIVKPAYSTSKEKYWSLCRNAWFNQFEFPVVTGHNLSDALEWYLMTCFTGEGHFMLWKNKNVSRPFLTTDKADMEQYCLDRGLDWYSDPTNYDLNFTARNRIRHTIIPEIEKLPGNLKTVVRNNIIRKNS